MRVNRDSIAATLATVAFAIVVILGFWKTRGPSAQRLIRTDEKRLQNMNQLANELNRQYGQHNKQLPDGLSDLQKTNYADPITKKRIEYSAKPPTRYALCTTFATDSPNEQLNGTFAFWGHTAGHKCFEFEAAEQVPQAPDYYY